MRTPRTQQRMAIPSLLLELRDPELWCFCVLGIMLILFA